MVFLHEDLGLFRSISLRNLNQHLLSNCINYVIEEAVRSWFAGRKDYNEILPWVRLEKEYQRNLEAFRRYSAYSFPLKRFLFLIAKATQWPVQQH